MTGIYNNQNNIYMEIAAIEKRTFEQMMQRFEDFQNKQTHSAERTEVMTIG